MNKFTSLSTFKAKNSSADVYTMSWVYAGITAWFSQQDRFRELEFREDVSTVFVKDWRYDDNLIDQSPNTKKYFGLINEGHPDYWFPLSQWSNTTLITGHDHAMDLDRGNRSIGFDRWDFHMYKISTDPRISQEINRHGVQSALYDVLVLPGTPRSHRIQWINEFDNHIKDLRLLIGHDHAQINNARNIRDMGYEEYFNKISTDEFRPRQSYESFFDQDDHLYLPFLPHRRMFRDCKVNAVLETTGRATDFPFVTEKTLKPMIHARPFVVFGDTGTLQKLRQEGFMTFSEFCDEGYDQETDAETRIKKSIQAVHQLIDACDQCPDKIDAICDHNQKHFFNIHRLETKLVKFGQLCMKTLYS